MVAPASPLRSPSPRDGSLASGGPQPPDNSFEALAGGIENPNPKTPRKLGPKDIADVWIQVDRDLKQSNFKRALRTLSNYHASGELNGPQYQKTLEYITCKVNKSDISERHNSVGRKLTSLICFFLFGTSRNVYCRY